MVPLTVLSHFSFFSFFFIIFFFKPSFQSHVSISLNSTTLSKSGDSILIQWSGIDYPSDLDWLGIYSPYDSPDDHFLGYVFLSKSPTWESGSGNISLPIVNLRSKYSFRIFRWTRSEIDWSRLDKDHNPLPGTAHLLASSKELSFESGRGPEQIHLSFTDNDDEMRVMYITEDRRKTYVRYGEKKGKLDSVAAASIQRYEREHMCHAPANASLGWRDPGYIHDGVMTKLKKGVRYFYKVGNDHGGWSETHSFVSRNNDSDETIAFLFGDMGTATPYSTFMRTQEEGISTMKWILRDVEALGEKPSFISHVGDISYARGYAWLWDLFFTQIEPVAAQVAYHVCVGNHDYDWPLQPFKPYWARYRIDSGGECGVPYSLKFNMPGNSSEPTGTKAPATRNLYYSFDMGAVHFVYMSTETNFLPGSNQYKFLKHDLESVDRKKTPFIIIQGHRPMYTTSYEFRDAGLRARMLKHLEPLFVKNRVTLALWGHVHKYERFCPLNNFTCSTDSVSQKREEAKSYTIHMVIGMGGQDWQHLWEPRSDHPTDPVFPQPKRSLYRGSEFGYTRLVATKKKLVLSYVGNHDGKVHDTVEILASGEAMDAGAKGGGQSTSSWYVKGGSVLVFGALIGYILGFIAQARKKPEVRGNWTPLNTEEP